MPWTLQEMYDDDMRKAMAKGFDEGRTAAADALLNWRGTLKSDPDRRTQNLFESIARGTRNPYRNYEAVAE